MYDAAIELKNTVVSTAFKTLLTLQYITVNLAYQIFHTLSFWCCTLQTVPLRFTYGFLLSQLLYFHLDAWFILIVIVRLHNLREKLKEQLNRHFANSLSLSTLSSILSTFTQRPLQFNTQLLSSSNYNTQPTQLIHCKMILVVRSGT